jgi:hypothetical protein
VRRSAKVVGVVSARPWKSLMRPFFSATNTRPSGAKASDVGRSSPSIAASSWKPGFLVVNEMFRPQWVPGALLEHRRYW